MAEEKETIKIKLLNLRHPFHEPHELRTLIRQSLGIQEEEITAIQIIKRAIDARQDRLDVVYTLAVEIAASKKTVSELCHKKDIEPYHPQEIYVSRKISSSGTRPIIIGCGPSGIFAALTLAEQGAPPLIIERGARIAQRIKDVNAFWKNGTLNPESNVFFGEGGAGTFSDGKLTTRIKSPFKIKVLQELVNLGAPEEILYINKPHLGTDRIRRIIPLLVQSLEQRGVEFLFNTQLKKIIIEQGVVKGVWAGEDFIEAENVFLATGHSARDVYEMLKSYGIVLETKGFAVGLRIEHPQEFINRVQWKVWAGTPGLGPADYFLSFNDTETGRGVYTFCMCPGGFVTTCSSRHGEVLTNGMSAYRRASPWANAAVVVTIAPGDFKSADPLAGIALQRELEEKAFMLGGEDFRLPVQTARDFIDGMAGQQKNITGLCRPGVTYADLGVLLPGFVREPLKRALVSFDKKMPGFIAEGLLLGVESRTSSPVRIKRNPHNFHAVGINGLIPIGEGAGYAGGIVSCAVDGIRAAQHFKEV